MKRREFMTLGGLSVLGLGVGANAAAVGLMTDDPVCAGDAIRSVPARRTPKADTTITIAPVTVELTPKLIFSTIGYNGTAPGPILRMREGVPHIVDVVNDTDVPELVHWHGLLLPPELHGAEEEGTPPVPPHGRRRY